MSISKAVSFFPVKNKWKQAGSVMFFQVLVFAITFCTNILILRVLSKSDYAVFTVCFQMLGVVSLLSDSGITPAFRNMAGKFWKSPQIFSSVVNSKLQLRNQLMVAVIPVSLAIATFLFYKQGLYSYRTISWLCLLAILVYLEVQRGVYTEILRSMLEIKKVQMVDTLLNLFRFAFGLLAILTSSLEVLLLAYLAASLCAAYYARLQAQKFFSVQIPAKRSYKKIMTARYKELLPNSVFFIIQSQIAIFLLAFFHKSAQVADYGALGRITVIFNMMNAVVLNLFAARFSRSQQITELRSQYFKIIAALLGGSLFLLFAVYLFRHPILLILGPKYAGLDTLLMLLTLNSCITFVMGSIGMLNNAKSWIFFNARFAIPVSVLSLVVGGFLLNFSRVSDIIIYSMLPVFFTGLLKLADSLRGLKLAFYKR